MPIPEVKEYQADQDNQVVDFKVIFEEKLLETIRTDFTTAQEFMSGYHRFCENMSDAYNNAKDYEALKKKGHFPVPFFQKNIDSFADDALDKIFYADRPARIVGREKTDKADAQVKQEFMAYLDEIDNIYIKMHKALKDGATYLMLASQVDYEEVTEKRMVEIEIPEYEVDELGQPVFDENNEPQKKVDGSGNTILTGKKEWVKIPEIVFQGARTKRLDPRDVFFTQDKQDINDEFPIMTRTRQSLNYFYSKDYFFNVKKLKEANKQGRKSSGTTQDGNKDRGRNKHTDHQTISPGRPYQYIEWHGTYLKSDLYKYLAIVEPERVEELEENTRYLITDIDQNQNEFREMIEIDENELAHCIGGVVDGETLVRIEESAFDGPNIVIGFMEPGEEGMLGTGLADKISAIHYGQQEIIGMHLVNMEQSVNAEWIININALVNKKSVTVNKPGNVHQTNSDVNNAVKRIEPGNVSPDILNFYWLLEQMGKDAGKVSDPIQGKGDPNSETLGEFSAVLTQALIGMRSYLKSIENSYIIPLYKLRNKINAEFIGNDYVYRVLGKKGERDWKIMTPQQNRAAVDFVCESSTRETQKAVLIQQILQLAKISPLAISAGQPVRIDKLLARLCEIGFSWNSEQIEDFLPLIRMEKEDNYEDNSPIDKMLAENALLMQAIQRLELAKAFGTAGLPGLDGQPSPQPGQGGSPGGPVNNPVAQPGRDIKQSGTEGNAVKGANASFQTQVGNQQI